MYRMIKTNFFNFNAGIIIIKQQGFYRIEQNEAIAITLHTSELHSAHFVKE